MPFDRCAYQMMKAYVNVVLGAVFPFESMRGFEEETMIMCEFSLQKHRPKVVETTTSSPQVSHDNVNKKSDLDTKLLKSPSAIKPESEKK
jgi:hypothetical protein